jgi:nucleoside phosphorylase
MADGTQSEQAEGDVEPMTAFEGSIPYEGPVDVVIVTATADELERVKYAFGPNWNIVGRAGFVYYLTVWSTGSRTLTLVAAQQNRMGLVQAALTTNRLVSCWKPRLVAMTGVCAGNQAHVRKGDLVAASEVFDYGSGKIADGKLIPDYHSVSTDDSLLCLLTMMAADRQLCEETKNSWPVVPGRPDTELTVHVGAFASGAAVVADERIVKDIATKKRSVRALDMEAYGVASASIANRPPLPFLVIKGVQDFADGFKSDEYRSYCAHVSAVFLRAFLARYADSTVTK